MNVLSMNNLWSYLQGLSLTASNQRWLAERLIKALNSRVTTDESKKLEKLNSLFGAWSGDDGERMENAIRKGRIAAY